MPFFSHEMLANNSYNSRLTFPVTWQVYLIVAGHKTMHI